MGSTVFRCETTAILITINVRGQESFGLTCEQDLRVNPGLVHRQRH